MDSTQSETKRRTRSHSGRKSIVAVLGLVVLVVLSTPVLTAGDFDLDEGFEDGDEHVEYENWGDWQDTTDVFTPQQNLVLNETWSGALNTSSDQRVFVKRNSNTSAVERIVLYAQINNTNEGSGFADSASVEIKDLGGSDIAQVGFTTDDSSEINAAGNSMQLQTGTTYKITFYDFDFTSGNLNVSVKGGGNSIDGRSGFNTNAGAFGEIHLATDYDNTGPTSFVVDNIQVTLADRYNIDGRVTDQDDDPIQGVTVNATDSNGNTFKADTDKQGKYEITGLVNETYTVKTEAEGYTNESASVTIDGADETQDFQLIEQDEALHLDTKEFVGHGESISYTVEATYFDSNGDKVTRKDVTDDTTVTSNDTSLVSVDEVNHELDGTSVETHEGKALITANWTNPDGELVQTSETVVVANKTLDNMELLPPWPRIDAVVGSNVDTDGPDGLNATWLLIMAGAVLSGVMGRVSGTYSALAGFSSVIILGWILGRTGTGVLLITLAVVGFVGLNLAANIDYGPVGN